MRVAFAPALFGLRYTDRGVAMVVRNRTVVGIPEIAALLCMWRRGQHETRSMELDSIHTPIAFLPLQ